MPQEDNEQFKLPDEDDLTGPNPPPAGPKPGSYQEATPKVDNFSPPQDAGGDSSGDSFVVPSGKELKKPETPEKEPEDIFAKKEETPSPPEPKVELEPEPETPPPSPTGGPVSPGGGQGGQKLGIPENKGYGYLWVILLLLIIMVLVEAIAINELGIFNLGLEKYYGAIHLEKLWGGLPAEAKPALADSVKKMAGKNFNLDGSSQLSINLNGKVQGIESTGTGAANIKSDLGKILEGGLNFQNEVKINGSFQSPDKLEIDLATDAGEISGNLPNLLGVGAVINLSLISDGNDIYVENNNLKTILGSDKDWIKIINSNQKGESSNQTAKVSDLISSGERTGSAKIDGVSCYIYEVKVNGAQLSNYLSNHNSNFAWLAQDIYFQSLKIYLGKRDHLMHKIEASFSNTPDSITIKNKLALNFSDIGKQVTINIPVSDTVVEKNWNEVKNTFISGTATPTPTSTSTPQDRDKQRKADLKKIQDALLAYKVQNGKYPSTAGAVEKTRDATSNLKTALVPKYLDSLPVDPENDKYYYGYKSDNGTKCEITSILEVTTDPDGENINGYWIYKLRGN